MTSSLLMMMFDDVNPDLLPAGYDAYAGYVDGKYPDYQVIRSKFPRAQVLSIDAIGSQPTADALDVEPGDASNALAVGWAKAKIAANSKLIVLYTSVSNVNSLISTLAAAGITRAQVKIWSAHYGAGAHICGPATCGLTAYACDGTQFTSTAFGDSLDESLLLNDFFGNVVIVQPATDPNLIQGDTGDAVKTLQTRLNVWGYKVTVDGDFGTATLAAVKDFQTKQKLTVDGVVGPQTWGALNVAPPAPKPPAPKPYPAPGHLGEDFTKYALTWDAVVVSGKAVRDYQVVVVQLNGKVLANDTVTGTSTVLSKLTGTYHYNVHVAALGGPAPLQYKTIQIIA